MQLVLEPQQDGHILLTGTLLDYSPCRRIPLLDRHLRRNGKWQLICSKCLNIDDPGQTWGSIEDILSNPYDEPASGLPMLSYTICPECKLIMQNIVEQLH